MKLIERLSVVFSLVVISVSDPYLTRTNFPDKNLHTVFNDSVCNSTDLHFEMGRLNPVAEKHNQL